MSATASVRLAGEDTDRTIDGFELFSARRALELLKRKLGRERLLDLLPEEIAAGDAFLRDHVAPSAGRRRPARPRCARTASPQPQFGAGSAPPSPARTSCSPGTRSTTRSTPTGRRVNIVETLGEHVCSFFMREWDDSATGTDALAATGGSAARRSHMVLEDGTVVGSIANTFVEEPDGFTARLSVTLPVTCGPPVIEQHLEHFAVEFRNWILGAAAEGAR